MIFKKDFLISATLGVIIVLILISCETDPKYGPLADQLGNPFDAKLLVVETDYSESEDENDTAVCKILNKENHKVLVYFYGENLPQINDTVSVNNFKLRSPADSSPEYAYYDKYLKSQNIRYTSFVGEKYYKITAQNQGCFPAKQARAFNSFLNKKIQTTFKNLRTSALLRGLFLGDKDGFSPEDYDAFKASGSVHIVSVSGYHVMLLLSISSLFLKKLPRILKDLATALFLLFLILVTGCTPSVIRAAVMVMIGILSVYFRRDNSSENALCLIAICLIISNRYIINNVSFVLSFSATYGIIKCFRAIDHLTSSIPSFIRAPVCTTISAQIGVFPAMMLYFGTTSLYSVIPNIILSFVVPILFMAAPLALITQFDIIIKICDIICELLFNMIHSVADLPFNTLLIQSSNISLILMTLTAYLTCNLLYMLHIKKTRKKLKGDN